MPASTAGLVRYMDEEGSGYKLKPQHILYGAGGVIGIEILLKLGLI